MASLLICESTGSMSTAADYRKLNADCFRPANYGLTVTGAMADEFRSADGRRDIYTMFTRAASKVTSSSNQQPLFTSTATKTLTLPPVV